jgi:hypothetical protein
MAGPLRTVSLVSLLPALAMAQSAVRGTVRADSTLRPVPRAEIVLESAEPRTGRAGLDGAFVFGRLPAGRHQLVIRAIGFRPLRLTADLNGRDTLDLDVRLTPVVQQLAPLAVVGRRAPASANPDEFERRRRNGFGRFFTRAQLRDREAMRLTDFLRTATGIRFVVLPIGCGSGLALASMRPRATPPPPSMDCGSHKVDSACYLDLFIDGFPVWQWGQSPPPDVDQFAVRQLQAVEIYTGLAQMPPEFPRSEGGCGAVVMWSRTPA